MSGPNIKDPTHQKRTGGHTSPSVNVTPSMVFTGKRDIFLKNIHNKAKFISLLSQHLKQNGCVVKQSDADADLLIVQTTIDVAKEHKKTTILVGDDTDLLILLCHHTAFDLTNLYFCPQTRSCSHKAQRCWNIALLKNTLGNEVSGLILFAHAILGCDSTSRLYGIGKAQSLKLLRNSQDFRRDAKVFMNPKA